VHDVCMPWLKMEICLQVYTICGHDQLYIYVRCIPCRHCDISAIPKECVEETIQDGVCSLVAYILYIKPDVSVLSGIHKHRKAHCLWC